MVTKTSILSQNQSNVRIGNPLTGHIGIFSMPTSNPGAAQRPVVNADCVDEVYNVGDIITDYIVSIGQNTIFSRP